MKERKRLRVEGNEREKTEEREKAKFEQHRLGVEGRIVEEQGRLAEEAGR